MSPRPRRSCRRGHGLFVFAFIAPAADDWPCFLGPQANGHSAETGVQRDWSAGGPPERWSVEVGNGYGGAAVRDGEVYLLDREFSKADILRCLSLESGEELWRHQYGASGRLQFHGSRSVPTVTEKYVYAQGAFGHLSCYDRQSHEPVWTLNLRRQYRTFMPLYGWVQSPLVVGELVFAAPLSEKVGLVALNRFTGEEVWKTEGMGSSHSTPQIVTLHGEDQLLFLSGSLRESFLFSFAPESGTLLWKTDAYSARLPIPIPVPLGGDRLFLTSGYQCGSAVVQVDRDAAGDHSIRTVAAHPRGAQVHTPLVIDDHVYVIANQNENDTRRKRSEGGLVCFDLEAREQWRTGDEPYLGRGSTLVVDGLLLIQDGRTGVLRLVEPSPEEFRLLASKDVFGAAEERRDLRMWAPMALSNGKLLLRSQTELKCLELISSSAADEG